jgi:uncharacterized protein YbjT (DUF2867 family)
VKSQAGSTADPVLIAGSTGYIGRLLAERLTGAGIPTRCLARNPAKATDLESAGCEVVRGDVLDRDSLRWPLSGVRVAYYLVHSMGRGADGDFAETDLEAARNFAEAAAEVGVERIIYLGGLGEGGSRHLQSRHETATALASTGVDLTYLRAAVVVGSGSESFRTIYYLVRRLPMMITPRWTDTKTQPIGIDDVIECLARALELEGSREIQIGGPDVTTYGGMMDEMAHALGKRPPLRLGVPLLTPKLSALWLGLVTPVDVGVAKPLVEGLSTETIVTEPGGMELLGVDPAPLRETMKKAAAMMAAEA